MSDPQAAENLRASAADYFATATELEKRTETAGSSPADAQEQERSAWPSRARLAATRQNFPSDVGDTGQYAATISSSIAAAAVTLWAESASGQHLTPTLQK
jgi:hypothetical protein